MFRRRFTKQRKRYGKRRKMTRRLGRYGSSRGGIRL